MTRLTILLFLLLPIIYFAQGHTQDIHQPHQQNYEQLLNVETQILENLKLLETDYIEKLPRKDKKNAKRLLKNTLALMHQLRIREAINPNIIDPNSFAVLLNEVNNSVFDSDKEKIIYTFTRNKMILTVQAKELLLLYRLEWDRFDILEMIYPAIIDKENIIMLLPLFSNSIYKSRFVEFINENSL